MHTTCTGILLYIKTLWLLLCENENSAEMGRVFFSSQIACECLILWNNVTSLDLNELFNVEYSPPVVLLYNISAFYLVCIVVSLFILTNNL